MAADVAYLSFIYSMVQPSYYQRVTSYFKGAILLGYVVDALLAQLLVSLGGVSLFYLAFQTLMSVTLITSLFLTTRHAGLFQKETHSAQQGNSGEDTIDSEMQDFFMCVKSVSAAQHVGRMSLRLILDCKKCLSSVAVVFFCTRAATGRCGFYHVSSYVQLLWLYIQPHNFTT